MQYYPQNSKGFAINHELAETLNVLDQLLLWEEEYNEIPLFEAFENKFGFEPNELKHFQDNNANMIHGLQGFDYDSTYILFDDNTQRFYPQEWDNLLEVLENHDVNIIEGSWAEEE